MRITRWRIASVAVVGVLMVGLTGPATSAQQDPGGSPNGPSEQSGSSEQSGPSSDLAPLPTGNEQAPGHPPTDTDPQADGLPADGNLRAQVLDDPDERVVVEVLHDAGRGDAVSQQIVELGGSVHGPIADIGVEGEVPADAVAELEGFPGVQSVQEPQAADPEKAVTGDPELALLGSEVTLTNADDWQAAGITGAGVKVGVIDSFLQTAWTTAVATGDLAGQPAGTFCRRSGVNCDVWAGSRHGVAVSEIIHEMAPDAQIYIASVGTAADFQAAIDYFQSQGVKVVTRSQTAAYDGPGNGTGPIAAVVDSAVAKGMVYLNSAGNSAGGGSYTGSYWRGGWADNDGDGWIDFVPGDELLGTRCWFWNGLRWSDWATNRTDYDVYVFNSSGQQISGSTNRQGSGLAPIEANNNIGCGADNAVVYIGVWKFADGNGTAGDVLEFMVNGVGVERWQNPYSASGPMGDTANPGALTIGAIDPAANGVIAGYSSQGPTNDARIKPDLSAPACVASTSYTPNCFNGTSAATPVVAGAAALALSTGAAAGPAGVANYLRTSVVDRGSSGNDNVYGKGELRLALPPPVSAPPPSPTPRTWSTASTRTSSAGCPPPPSAPTG
ncbi:S8 family serine peptidase [Aquihabitans daechungensis]|uniref:S8 family serine peptidase n=1 Tax=Aquihabitans daechungensis TaxID=1052257 RepID=UPI003B9EDAD0